jgi:hypothetical protein
MADNSSGLAGGTMRGDLMGSRNFLAATLMACLLAVGFLGIAPVANAESRNEASLRPGKSAKSAKNVVIDIKRPRRGPRIPLPIGPSYVYYDYPYYYSRGYYPRHIGGYVYYPYPYDRGYYRGHHRAPEPSHR